MKKTRNKHGPDIDIGLRMGWPRGPAVITGEPPPEVDVGALSHIPGNGWSRYYGYRNGVPSVVPDKDRHCELRAGPPDKVATRGDPPGERRRSEMKAAPPGIPKGATMVQSERRPLTRMVSFRWLSEPLDHRGNGWNYGGSSIRAAVPRPSSLVPDNERQNKLGAVPKAFITLRRTGESPPGNVKELSINYIDSTARNNMPARGRLEVGDLKDKYWLTATTVPCFSNKKARKDAKTQRDAKMDIGFWESVWMYGESSIGAAVPRPSTLVPWNWMYGECSLGAAVPRPSPLVPKCITIETIENLKYLNN